MVLNDDSITALKEYLSLEYLLDFSEKYFD